MSMARPRRPLSRGALAAVVVAVILATAAGAVIGSQVAVIACGGGCVPTAVLAGAGTALLTAVGTMIIGLLVARAFAEWDEIKRSPGATAQGD